MSLPELQFVDLLDVFVPGAIQGRVRITKSAPLVGELLRDASAKWFLAPEEDYRGGGMHSIEVHDLPADVRRRYTNRLVKVAGVFEDGHGLDLEAIALQEKPFPE